MPLSPFTWAAALAAAALLAGAPAFAQSCGDRQARMEKYMAEARNLRATEAALQSASQVSGRQLDQMIRQTEDLVRAARRTGGQSPLMETHLDYLLALKTDQMLGLRTAQGEHPFLAGVRARRERVATNIAHSRAAMESMRCADAAAQQPRPPQVAQPQDYGPLGEGFCCEWTHPVSRNPTCSPMRQPPRCAAHEKGTPMYGHYCHAYTGRCTPAGK
jgi:hypothetical protein